MGDQEGEGFTRNLGSLLQSLGQLSEFQPLRNDVWWAFIDPHGADMGTTQGLGPASASLIHNIPAELSGLFGVGGAWQGTRHRSRSTSWTCRWTTSISRCLSPSSCGTWPTASGEPTLLRERIFFLLDQTVPPPLARYVPGLNPPAPVFLYTGNEGNVESTSGTTHMPDNHCQEPLPVLVLGRCLAPTSLRVGA
jgi:hypothetical protein